MLPVAGLDEGGQIRDQIERHVTEVLAPQGHVMLVSSRPAGINEERFEGFHRVHLQPLTPVQQKAAIELRLGCKRAQELLPYLERVPLDAETGQRVTGNPLMLSMVASVFEIRQGMAMPETIAELYQIASQAMLRRDGDVSPELEQLLLATFFEAHVTTRRIIGDQQLAEAALGLSAPDTLNAIRQKAMAAPFEDYGEKPALGHYVEVLSSSGRRGCICVVDAKLPQTPYRVSFEDGSVTSYLRVDDVRTSGRDMTAFLVRAMQDFSDEVHAALPEGMRDAVSTVRSRVLQDKLPLLSLLQVRSSVLVSPVHPALCHP